MPRHRAGRRQNLDQPVLYPTVGCKIHFRHARIDCRELWVATANYKTAYVGKFAYDRFRTDVTWPEQLAATMRRDYDRYGKLMRDFNLRMD